MRSGVGGTDHAERGHDDEVAVAREKVTHQCERRPSDFVDFVVGSELAACGLHRPEAGTSSASLSVGVAHLGKFLAGGASQPGLLADFPERALERRLSALSSAFGQRPVLSVHSVDNEHLVVMPVGRTPHDPASGLDHTLDVRFGVLRPDVSFDEREASQR